MAAAGCSRSTAIEQSDDDYESIGEDDEDNSRLHKSNDNGINRINCQNGCIRRIIALIDMDCFYAQVEQRRRPELWGKPVAVVQHNQYKGGGIIAVNYEARAAGVKRRAGMRGDDAKRVCPELTLCAVPISEHTEDKADLSRYREASAEVFKVLNAYDESIIVERASIDEAYLDLTALVNCYSLSSDFDNPTILPNIDDLPATHVATGNDRPSDANDNDETEYDRVKTLKTWINNDCANDEQQLQLAHAAVIVSRIRARILAETQFHCSAGIGSCKTLAKLVCARHKPRQQTIIPDQYVNEIYKTTPISSVRNFGGKLGRKIVEIFRIQTMYELSQIPSEQLWQHFGQTANWIEMICRGTDDEEVKARDIAQSIGVSKNYTGKSALASVEDVSMRLKQLVKELVIRLIDDQLKNNRTAESLSVGCCTLVDGHISRHFKFTGYTIDAIYHSSWSVLKHLNKSKMPNDVWDPPLVNLSLNASKFCPGIVGASKPITDWIERRVDELEMRHVRDNDGNDVYKNETEFREHVQKTNHDWQEYKRMQALPTSAIPDDINAIPREILADMPDDIRHELMHFYNLKAAKEDQAKRQVTIGSGKLSKKRTSKRIDSVKSSSSVKCAKISDYFR